MNTPIRRRVCAYTNCHSVLNMSTCSKMDLARLLLNTTCPVLANSVEPDQLASEEANWSGSTLFVIKNVNFYQNPDQVIWLAGN